METKALNVSTSLGKKKRDKIFLHLREAWIIREFFTCVGGNNISFQRLGSNKGIYKRK